MWNARTISYPLHELLEAKEFFPCSIGEPTCLEDGCGGELKASFYLRGFDFTPRVLRSAGGVSEVLRQEP